MNLPKKKNLPEFNSGDTVVGFEGFRHLGYFERLVGLRLIQELQEMGDLDVYENTDFSIYHQDRFPQQMWLNLPRSAFEAKFLRKLTAEIEEVKVGQSRIYLSRLVVPTQHVPDGQLVLCRSNTFVKKFDPESDESVIVTESHIFYDNDEVRHAASKDVEDRTKLQKWFIENPDYADDL